MPAEAHAVEGDDGASQMLHSQVLSQKKYAEDPRYRAITLMDLLSECRQHHPKLD